MSAKWQMSCWYLVLLLVLVLLMKFVSLRTAGIVRPGRILQSFFFWAPWLCLSSWEKTQGRAVGRRREVVSALLSLVPLAPVYFLIVPLIRPLPWWLQSYLAIVPFWLLLEAIDGLCRLLWLPFGLLVPSINRCPWRAATLADFWGNRWNRLFGDWLRRMVFMPIRRRRQTAAFVTFLVSGLLHELLVSVPLALVYGEHIWGWMTAYFLLQYLAMALDRQSRLPPLGRRLLLWASVLLPAPLVLNPGTLRIFHLGG